MSEQRATRKQPLKGVKKGRPDLKEPTMKDTNRKERVSREGRVMQKWGRR